MIMPLAGRISLTYLEAVFIVGGPDTEVMLQALRHPTGADESKHKSL